jgi:hypothetical protein
MHPTAIGCIESVLAPSYGVDGHMGAFLVTHVILSWKFSVTCNILQKIARVERSSNNYCKFLVLSNNYLLLFTAIIAIVIYFSIGEDKTNDNVVDNSEWEFQHMHA